MFGRAYASDVNADDNVCLCFHVSLHKIRGYLEREDPPVASLISECLGAGTGCQWCVPFLKHLHAQHVKGETPDLRISPQEYAEKRLKFHATGDRELKAGEEGGASDGAGPAPGA